MIGLTWHLGRAEYSANLANCTQPVRKRRWQIGPSLWQHRSAREPTGGDLSHLTVPLTKMEDCRCGIN